MTPISTTVLPKTNPSQTQKHMWSCCFGCKCFRKVSQSPVNTVQQEGVANIYDIAVRLPTKQDVYKVNPIKKQGAWSCISAISSLEGMFEPRDFMEIDAWVYPVQSLCEYQHGRK